MGKVSCLLAEAVAANFGDGEEAGSRTVGVWWVAKKEGLFVEYLRLIADAWTTTRVILLRLSRRGEVQNGIRRRGAWLVFQSIGHSSELVL